MQKATMKILFDDIGTNIKQFNDVELKLLGLIIESTVMMWCNNLHSLDENPYHRAENRCQLTLKNLQINNKENNMQNIESFLEKNPTLYKCLLNNANVYPEEVKFYTDNAPRTVETYNAVSDELENILNKHTQLSLEEKINIHNEYMDLVNGMNIEERDFNFLYGLKVGAKMMIELLQD